MAQRRPRMSDTAQDYVEYLPGAIQAASVALGTLVNARESGNDVSAESVTKVEKDLVEMVGELKSILVAKK